MCIVWTLHEWSTFGYADSSILTSVTLLSVAAWQLSVSCLDSNQCGSDSGGVYFVEVDNRHFLLLLLHSGLAPVRDVIRSLFA